MDDRIPPGHIIDGDAEQRAAEDRLGDVGALQMVSTALLVGRQIIYAKTEGTDAVFSVEFEDGSGMTFKMLDYRHHQQVQESLKKAGRELMTGEFDSAD